MGREGWAAAIVGSVGQEWDVERRFRVTEVALAIMWVCIPLICYPPTAYSYTDYLTVLCIRISFLFLC